MCMKYKYYRRWKSTGKCIILDLNVYAPLGWLVTSKQYCPTEDTFIYYSTVYLIDVKLNFVWLGRVQWVQSLEEAGLQTDFGVTTCTRGILKCPVMSQAEVPVAPVTLMVPRGTEWFLLEEKRVSYKSSDQELCEELITAVSCFNWSKFPPPGLMSTMVTQPQCLVVSLGQDFMCRVARVLCYGRPMYRTF